MNYGILLSGGTGSRIRSEIPKQYIRSEGHMMVTLSLAALLRSPHIDRVHIVADEAWREDISADAEDEGLPMDKLGDFAEPGVNRQGSILNAMEVILKQGGEAGNDDTVLIHDAARPFLTAGLIEACHKALPGHDGVMPVLPMKDTVYLSKDGRTVSELINRSTVYAGQAPELFLLKPYYKANIKLVPEKILKINGASEPAVLDGMDIAMIPGDEGNYKVTTDADLERFLDAAKERTGA